MWRVLFNWLRYDDTRRNYLFNWYTGPTEVIHFYILCRVIMKNTIRNSALSINTLLKSVNNTKGLN